jgi:hypothetical protein
MEKFLLGLGKVDFITRWAVWRIANSRRSKASKGGVPFNNQKKVAWDSPARGIAAFTAANWQPNENFPFPEASRTRTIFHWLPAQNPQCADIEAPPGIERTL